MHNHIMIDIETLGTRPGCAILSIGAVVFDPVTGQIGEEFYRNISRASCEAAGLVADPATVAWWADQPESARAALMFEQVPLYDALPALTDFYRQSGASRLWSQGPSFDPVILEAAYAAVSLSAPWSYDAPRDTRTVYDLAGIKPDKSRASLHDALEDAKAQAADVHKGYLKLGLAEAKNDPIFQGRGGPLNHYKAGEADWPSAWRGLPEAADDADLYEIMASMTDDVVLRTAVNCWDNCLRLPAALEGVAAGLLSAHARFMVGLNPALDPGEAGVALAEGWAEMARQAKALDPSPVRTCRHCGCTDTSACQTPNGPCHWVSADVCSAPGCVAAAEGDLS